ncbi:MAG TPA: efflux transporter outer membrane subunit [Bryobacteraceae bacterium]|jgi:NodT family efflux transporter outer membrane factor (OMF) lipoprotein|nr:efflux transporter outer membrane subunit [Bryobacteraceae bacterium]
MKHLFELNKLALITGLALALFLAGCTVGPKYSKPSVATPVSYKELSETRAREGWKEAEPRDGVIRGDWWTIFGDSELNSLEERLNRNNQNIAVSFQNYMAARALVRNARSSLFPTVSVGFSATHTAVGPGSTIRASNSISQSSYELPLDVSWEPDLFGRIRNTIREYANAAQVSAANLANERLSEQASLAEYFFELRGQDALAQIYNETVKSYEETLKLTQSLVETGINSQQDVVQAETNLRTARANATSIGIARAQYEHAIALLIGQPASDFSIAVRPLDTKPPAIPTGLPSQLLERRPDIAAAERTMAEANALIGVGKAAYYPTVSLSGSAGTQTSSIGSLLSWPARFWSLGGSVSETVLDFGARRATVQQYEAQYNADVATYRQTVLNAFKEVEDYLASTRILAAQLGEQEQAIESSRQYRDIAVARYQTGVDTYLNVLTAQNTLLSNQLSEVTARTSQMTTSVQLIAALGGGWDVTKLPSEKDVRAAR